MSNLLKWCVEFCLILLVSSGMPALWSAEAAWHETELHLVTDNNEQKQRNGTAWPPRVVGNIGLLFSS